MKIAVLANADSVHTRRWVISLCTHGIEIVLISLHHFDTSHYADLPNFKTYSLGFDSSMNYFDRKFGKLKYLSAVGKIRTLLDEEKPDLLHAYYASSFGLIGARCNFHPYAISVWGSDIYEFPLSSFVAKRIIKSNLAKADHIFATSRALANKTATYCSKEINVVPFGIDTNVFKKERARTLFDENDIVIGIIKTFEKVYGIEFLIRSFAGLCRKHETLPLKLMLAGKGSCEQEFKSLVSDLGIKEKVLFTGYADHSQIVKYYNNLDIFVLPSIRESFGVSALEASACELPVVATDTGGLTEVVENDITGKIVQVGDVAALTAAIEILILNENLRMELGLNGRKHVMQFYQWDENVQLMIKYYQNILQKT